MIKLALLSGTAAILMLSESALAQNAATPVDSADPAQTSGQLEEILVTAQRRQERLQDVPIAVAAVSANTLASKGIQNLNNISAAIPGLQFNVYGQSSQIFLRGIGSTAGDPNNEPSVALYVDGVYIATPSAGLTSFNNISQIEVLKGPQGTLFGRNSTGGVIQIITRDPSQEPSAEASVGYANYDTVTGNFYGTTGISDDASIDLAVQYRNQFKGYGRNTNLNIETNRDSSFGVRSKLLLTPGDRAEIRFTGDYSRSFSSRSDFQRPPGVLNFDGVTTPQNFDSINSVPSFVKTRQGGAAIRIDYDIDFARFVSISSYRKVTGLIQFDPDGSTSDIIHSNASIRQSNFSQEFQLIAPKGSSIDWLIGAYYFNGRAGYPRFEIFGQALGGGVAGYSDKQKTESASAYGQVTLEVVSRLKLTGGLRFTHERSKITGTTSFSGVDTTPASLASPIGFDKLTWRLAANYALTDDVSAYVSYNRGIKSGGFNLLGPADPGYAPETLDAYEIGLKSELFDRRLRLNAAAFWYDYQDIQFSVVREAGSFIDNAAKARIKGAEFDFEAVPIENLTISGGGTYLHGRYLEFPDAVVFPASPLTGPQLAVDAGGNRTITTPKFSGNIGFDYVIPTNIGEFSVASSVYYNDGYNFSLAPYPGAPGTGAGAGDLFVNKNYTTISASLGWQSNDETIGVRLWGSNLTNAYYFRQGSPSALGYIAVRADPRTYGITVSAKF